MGECGCCGVCFVFCFVLLNIGSMIEVLINRLGNQIKRKKRGNVHNGRDGLVLLLYDLKRVWLCGKGV